MAESFEDLGIAPALAAGARDLGWDAPSALQAAAAPVIRRGNNVVLHASSGAGVTGAWGLPLLERVNALDDDAGPAALVLTPSTQDASRVAATLARLGAPAGATIRALAPGWTGRPARTLVASASAALAAVRESALKLDGITILVVVAADRIQHLGDWAAVRTLTETAPSLGQKIVVTGAFDSTLEEYLDRHVRKALTVPPRPAEDDLPEPTVGVDYAMAAEGEKVDVVVALLPSLEGPEAALVRRSAAAAERLAGELAGRGITVEGAGAAAGDGAETPTRVLVLPAREADRRSTRAVVVSVDVPFDAGTLSELHANGGIVIVTPQELAHLRRIAPAAGVRLRARALPRPPALDAAASAREALRQALTEADLAPYLALIAPLLDEHPAAEIAAAALHLARAAGRGPSGQPAPTGAPGARAAASAVGAPAAAPAFVRLFVTVGRRDDINPGDLVGAITGEAGVAGETVGRIDIRESHSTVEVASTDAERVIAALNGRTLKGRSLRVDYDRKDRAAGAAGAGGERTPRTGGPRSSPRAGPGKGGAGRGGPGRGGGAGGSRGGTRSGPRGGAPGRPRGGSPRPGSDRRGGAGGG